jgi:Fic family protein
MIVYIHQLPGWPSFHWDENRLNKLLIDVHHQQGKLMGKMERIGFGLQSEATLHTLTLDVLKSSEIEGELLDPGQVRSSIARRLGMDIAGLIPSDRHVEGIVEMMLDATQHFEQQLTEERLSGWHAALFPTGRSGIHTIVVGAWRDNPPHDPMQVVSGPAGKEKVHYEAPAADLLPDEMKKFFQWFNEENNTDSVLKAAIAHLWFVTIHPFDDGNGRIARAIADLQLSRADGTAQRFYSMTAQIRKERNSYYTMLEQTQCGSLDITGWLEWFLQCISGALLASEDILSAVLKKASFWKDHATTIFNKRQVLLLNKLLDGFDGNLTSSKWAKIAKCSQDTALRDIQDLIEKKVLIKEDAGGRSSHYILYSAVPPGNEGGK